MIVWLYRVIPLSMKRVPDHIHLFKLCVCYLYTFWICVVIHGAVHAQSLGGCGRSNEIHNYFMAYEGPAAPVFADERKEAVLDLVPFAGAGRKMAYGDGKSSVVAQLLKLGFPKPESGAVTASAVCSDEHARCFRVRLIPHGEPPATDGFNGKGGRIVIDSYVDPTGILNEVIDAVGIDFPLPQRSKIVDKNLFRLPPGLPFPSLVFVVADKLLLFSVNGDDRLSLFLKRFDLLINMFKL